MLLAAQLVVMSVQQSAEPRVETLDIWLAEKMVEKLVVMLETKWVDKLVEELVYMMADLKDGMSVVTKASLMAD